MYLCLRTPLTTGRIVCRHTSRDAASPEGSICLDPLLGDPRNKLPKMTTRPLQRGLPQI